MRRDSKTAHLIFNPFIRLLVGKYKHLTNSHNMSSQNIGPWFYAWTLFKGKCISGIGESNSEAISQALAHFTLAINKEKDERQQSSNIQA